MIINHNISALNAHRQLGANQSAGQNSLEKLSSGLRINKAADDAAGLAISEKMRGQIRGLEMAERNAQDGISLIQTAEGALNESHAILQRMRELATQSANDTNTASDREKLQAEVDELSKELSRIGETTEFNTQSLLDGSFEGTFHIGANEGQNLSLSIGDMRAYDLGVVGEGTTDMAALSGTFAEGTNTTDADFADGEYTISFDGSTYNLVDESGSTVATSSTGQTFTLSTTDDTLDFGAALTSGTVTISDGGTTAEASVSADNQGLQAGEYTYDSSQGLLDSKGNVVATTSDGGKTFTNSDGENVLESNTALTAGTKVDIGGVDISSQSTADAAITTINDALESVSEQRSQLGAVQNRLNHTINNLGTSAENLTAAESRVRDVDMAKEMMEFTKNNILTQAAQSMLAQANQQPQGVLQLLQ
ncbi:flagellin N-terminal helical domain-containing protein [Oceanobacillus salinisoli]|uniref:flagellin N-terminal helical domain-containing protein n=1 Tax=Oceanobacillus salinisoli TaxID=2678611 RepID=UPI0012E18F5B|nr:flagellin [Oceanobacillus salinisoli]